MNITTYNSKHHSNPLNTFYVLSKGLNSGRPMSRPCANSLVVKANTEYEKQKLFGYTYVLWKTGRFHGYQVGSVIPFLRIEDYKRILLNTMESPKIDHMRIQTVLKHVVGLQNRQAALLNTVKVLKATEDAIIRSCIRF